MKMYQHMLHAVQVQEGLVAPDSPPDFWVPWPDDHQQRALFEEADDR